MEVVIKEITSQFKHNETLQMRMFFSHLDLLQSVRNTEKDHFYIPGMLADKKTYVFFRWLGCAML